MSWHQEAVSIWSQMNGAIKNSGKKIIRFELRHKKSEWFVEEWEQAINKKNAT